MGTAAVARTRTPGSAARPTLRCRRLSPVECSPYPRSPWRLLLPLHWETHLVVMAPRASRLPDENSAQGSFRTHRGASFVTWEQCPTHLLQTDFDLPYVIVTVIGEPLETTATRIQDLERLNLAALSLGKRPPGITREPPWTPRPAACTLLGTSIQKVRTLAPLTPTLASSAAATATRAPGLNHDLALGSSSRRGPTAPLEVVAPLSPPPCPAALAMAVMQEWLGTTTRR